MKMRTQPRRLALLLALLLGVVFLLPACAAKMNDVAEAPGYGGNSGWNFSDAAADYDYREMEMEKAPAPPTASVIGEDGAAGAANTPDATAGRKLIKNVGASIETKEFEACVAALEKKAVALGGYAESTERRQYSYAGARRWAEMTLRIPAAKLEDFKKAMGEKGKVVEINESVSDVTMDYTDLEAHIKALRTERDTLLRLMDEAGSLSDLLTVQERLTDVNYRLDSLESRIRRLDDQIDLSTVRLTISETEEYKPEEPKGFWAKVWYDLKTNTLGIGNGAVSIFGWFLGSLPILLLIAVAAVVVVLVIRRARRKRKAKRG